MFTANTRQRVNFSFLKKSFIIGEERPTNPMEQCINIF